MTMRQYLLFGMAFSLGFLLCSCGSVYGADYKVVYRYQTGPLGLIRYPMPVRVPITEMQIPDVEVNFRADDVVYHSLTPQEQKFIDELDNLRARHRLPKLTLMPGIVEDARRWSSHMRRVNRLYHGSGQENAAVGREDGRGVFNMWRSSPGHNAKLLNRNDTVGGVGQDGKWWTYRAASSIEVYNVGKDPASDLVVTQTTTVQHYKVVYREERGPLGILTRRVAIRVPVEEEGE